MKPGNVEPKKLLRTYKGKTEICLRIFFCLLKLCIVFSLIKEKCPRKKKYTTKNNSDVFKYCWAKL